MRVCSQQADGIRAGSAARVEGSWRAEPLLQLGRASALGRRDPPVSFLEAQ